MNPMELEWSENYRNDSPSFATTTNTKKQVFPCSMFHVFSCTLASTRIASTSNGNEKLWNYFDRKSLGKQTDNEGKKIV